MKAEVYSQNTLLRVIEADSMRACDALEKASGVFVYLKGRVVAFIPDGFAVILVENNEFDEAKKLLSEIIESKILIEDGYGEGLRLQGEVNKFIETYGRQG